MKREGLNISGFAVDGSLVRARFGRDAPDVKAAEFELRNVDLRFRDSSRDYGQIIDLQVHSWHEKDDCNDPKLLDWFILASPEIWYGIGIWFIRGYGWWYRRNGQNVVGDRIREQDECAGAERYELRLRPEAALNEKGEWLRDVKPPKPSKAQADK